MKELSKWIKRSKAFKDRERLPTIPEDKEIVIVSFTNGFVPRGLELRRTESMRDFIQSPQPQVRGRFIIEAV